MTRSGGIKLGLVLLALAGAGFLLWRAVGAVRAPSPDAPEGILWLCSHPECGRDFTLTTADLAAFYKANPDGTPACPGCGKSQSARAVRCAQCTKPMPALARSAAPGAKAPACPHCGAPRR